MMQSAGSSSGAGHSPQAFEEVQRLRADLAAAHKAHAREKREWQKKDAESAALLEQQRSDSEWWQRREQELLGELAGLRQWWQHREQELLGELAAQKQQWQQRRQYRQQELQQVLSARQALVQRCDDQASSMLQQQALNAELQALNEELRSKTQPPVVATAPVAPQPAEQLPAAAPLAQLRLPTEQHLAAVAQPLAMPQLE